MRYLLIFLFTSISPSLPFADCLMFIFLLGTAGDALSYHRGSAFSTKDRDNDESAGNCAVRYKGAWWYKGCLHSNLNGLYLHGQVNVQGMSWRHWKNSHYSVIRSEMKICPKDF